MRKRVFLLIVMAVSVSTLYGGSTGTTALHMPQGSGSSRAFGDFVSDPGSLNTFYRYFIEVPSGITRLQVELFDADVGLGGLTEDTAGRDRQRAGPWDSPVSYTLLDPSGTTRTTRFTTGDDTEPVGSDNAWLDLYNATGNDVLDQFGTAAYTNNDGNNNWATNWIETDSAGATATTGNIQVTGGQLRMQDTSAGTKTIYREADLLGTPGLNMGMAFLTFDFTTSGNLEDGDQITLEVSSNGGASWTNLETFSNDSTGNRSYDITAFISNTTRIRFTVSGFSGGTEFFYVDNVQISDGPITAGHWELRVAMNAGGDDINALGIRAHDGTSGSGGTELNVYADSMLSLGVNPPAAGGATRTYTLHPWVTSGCTCSQNDFDVDTNNGNTGSVSFDSRTGAFTQSFTSATLSVDDSWNRDNVTGWTSDDLSTDYGIWTLEPSISTYTNPAINGNYETTYVGTYATAANPPAANPIPTGTFRIYLPTDAGAAPVKPYLEQLLTQNRNFLGPNPPQVGVETTFTVTVRLVNPTAHAITFSATNLVTANIPGGQVLYGGNAGVGQGSIVSQPSVGGSGDITWNPGTLAAGATVIMHYDVRVTPTSGARIPVTGTPASGNGTRARFVDETGNTTQARATYTMGGLCEVAVTAGLATQVVLSKFGLDVRGGATTIHWSTASEAGTIGFNVYRANGERVNPRLIPASLQPHGGAYQIVDVANTDPHAMYFLEEVSSSGEVRRYGPFHHFEGLDRQRKMEEQRVHRHARTDSGAWSPESSAARTKVVAAMLGVQSTGVVRVPFADLATALDSKFTVVQKAADRGGIKVTSNGMPVAWTNDSQALYFFGEKTTSIYSNDRVYRLELANGKKMPIVPVTGATAPVSSFASTQDFETDVFAATILPLDPESDYWFWAALISGDPSLGRRTFSVDVPAVASSNGVTLSMRLQGANETTTHRARVWLNNVPIGETSWQDFAAKTATFSIPAAVLRDGSNEVVVEGVPGSDPLDIFYVDGFTFGYQRFARPDSGQIEVLRSGTVGAGPFTAAPMILNVTNRRIPSVLQGASFAGGVASLTTPSSVKALFFAQTYASPSFLRPVSEVKLKKSTRADWVIIAPRSMRTAAESLAALRARDGLAVLVADLEQVYDEFAGGNSTPHAIRDFYKTTRKWTRPPRYFVLAGTGTVDYRNLRGAQSAGPMPPLMTSTPDGLYASDSLFVDANNDRLPEVAIGRIPVSTSAELAAYVAKLDTNARVSVSQSPIVFSADTLDQGADFKKDSIRSEPSAGSRPITRIYLDDLGGTAARTSLLSAWAAGTPLVSWLGHGGLDQISSTGLLSSYDASSLQSNGRLPVLVAMTCTINRFENGFVDPLGTSLTKESGAGALAVWSASGLSQHSEAGQIQRTFMRLAGQNSGARLGDLVVQSLAAFRNDTSSIYLLLGDPAIRLDLPTEARNGGGSTRTGE